MKTRFVILLCVALGFSTLCIGQVINQTKIVYTYDNAGNRIKRELIVINIGLKMSNDTLVDPFVGEGLDLDEPNLDEEQQRPIAIKSTLDGANVKLYPNPVTETLIVSIDKFSDYSAEISVYDMSGRLLQKQNSSSRNAPISFLDYSVGTYVLRITVNDEQKEWLIVKK